MDEIYVPRQETSYAPFVISTEHGLFSWGGYGGVWHHFLPHYWGANSEWLDTRELVPHRRPTCMLEDSDAHLWIGTEGDGIVRLNADARRYNERSPENNAKSGEEFAYFGSGEVGCEFIRVNDLAAGIDGGIWAALVGNEKQRFIARYDGAEWSLVELPRIERHTTRGQQVVETNWWEGTPLAVAEFSPGGVLVGVDDVNAAGMYELDWDTREFRKVEAIDFPVREIELTSDGVTWAASWWGVYSRSVE